MHREAADLTKVALALRLNVSRNTVTKWESGEQRPTRPDDMAAVYRFCELFRLELADAWRALGYETPTVEVVQVRPRDPQLAKLFAIVEDEDGLYSEEVKAYAREIVAGLVKLAEASRLAEAPRPARRSTQRRKIA